MRQSLAFTVKKKSIFFGNKPRQLKTLFGEIHLTIPRLQCKACGKYFLFTETKAFGSSDIKNLAGANITPALRRIATLCGASWPFQQAEKVIKELTGVEVSHDHIQNLCASEAKEIEAKQEQTYDALVDAVIGKATDALTDDLTFDDTEGDLTGQRTTVAKNTEEDSLNDKKDRFYIGMDGVYIGEVDKNKHIEAKVGIVFTDERATISTGRNILLNKQYVGTFHDSQKFSEKLYCCAKEMGIQNQTELVILGDGARWVNRIAQMRYPKATLILDWWHLKRRVWETADYLKRDSLSEEQVVKWGKELVYSLWCGDTNKALTTILKLSNEISIDLHQNVKNDLDKRSLPALYHYIKNNQSLILDYQSYKQNGYFISSVFAEKAIDVLVCRRQKRRGMNWSLQGAENILILRQLVLNQQWDSHWQQQMAA